MARKTKGKMPEGVRRLPNGKLSVRWVDEKGLRRELTTEAQTLAEASRIRRALLDRKMHVEQGLELPLEQANWTVGEMMEWWLETYSAPMPSHTRNLAHVHKHILGTSLAALPVRLCTTGRVEEYLQGKLANGKAPGVGLAPATVNQTRGFLQAAINKATVAGKFIGANPVKLVKRKPVPEVERPILFENEIPAMLEALDDKWRPLFATAVYTGMRKGELLGLQRQDVDLANRAIIVRRSHGRNTTKSGKHARIPVHVHLVPYLQAALDAAPGRCVFPAAGGDRMREDVHLEEVLRRALARAGIVEGYSHVCRACKHAGLDKPVEAPDAAPRYCEAHKRPRKRWPVAQPRPMRFHDLRHTYGSNLAQSGVSMPVLTCLMRHSNPQMTMGTYVHMQHGFMQSQVDRLNFGGKPAEVDVAAMAVPRAVGADVSPAWPPDDDDPGPGTPSPLHPRRPCQGETNRAIGWSARPTQGEGMTTDATAAGSLLTSPHAPHNPKVVGSNPTPATPRKPGTYVMRRCRAFGVL
jgi:integrase